MSQAVRRHRVTGACRGRGGDAPSVQPGGVCGLLSTAPGGDRPLLLRRTDDPELTADLTAEVFAAALLGARRYRPGATPALAWLYGIAANKLADSRRRGRVQDEARRALDPLVLRDADIDHVEVLAGLDAGDGSIGSALHSLPPEQRDAVVARVVDERSYEEIPAQMSCSEMVVRQRVSRGLRALRSKIGNGR